MISPRISSGLPHLKMSALSFVNASRNVWFYWYLLQEGNSELNNPKPICSNFNSFKTIKDTNLIRYSELFGKYIKCWNPLCYVNFCFQIFLRIHLVKSIPVYIIFIFEIYFIVFFHSPYFLIRFCNHNLWQYNDPFKSSDRLWSLRWVIVILKYWIG